MLAGSEPAQTSPTLIACKSTFQLQGRVLELHCQGATAVRVSFLLVESNLNVHFVGFILMFFGGVKVEENFFPLVAEEESCFLWVFKSSRKESPHQKRFHLDLT